DDEQGVPRINRRHARGVHGRHDHQVSQGD
ncbi:hypothetical protein A2U01_0081682, partial [Trifolium medium]|nr:hypothetical protein [Trifolium medium]